MATTLSNPLITVAITAALTAGAPPAPAASPVNHAPAVTLTSGSGPGSVDRIYSKATTITSGTPLTINVSTALDPLNTAVGMLHVTSVMVSSDSTVAGQDLTIGGGTHPVLGSDQGTAQANGGIYFTCNPNPGYTVTGGSADTLTITVANGTNVNLKVTIVGRSA